MNSSCVIAVRGLLLMGAWLVFTACASSSKKLPSDHEQCDQGDARACVRVYQGMTRARVTAESEAFLANLCKMPRLSCHQLHPTEPVQSVGSRSDEVLLAQDVWAGGILVRKQVILYKAVQIAPTRSDLKPTSTDVK